MALASFDISSRKVCAAALCLFVTLLALPSKNAHARFDNPQVDGMPMDGCLSFAKDCEQTAAEYFCRQNGYAAVSGWATENSPSNTKTLRTKEVCNISQWVCGRFSYIECTQGLMPGAEAPAPPPPPSSPPAASSLPKPPPPPSSPPAAQSLMNDPEYLARPVGVGVPTHPDRILVLLHGINSDSSTWDALVARLGVSDNTYCPTLTPETSDVGHAQMARGVYCYRLNFGFYDSGRMGLEGSRDPLVACNAPAGCKGDYSIFDELGDEIYLKLRDIGSKHGQGTEIVLIGHSRGGLAARAFLQNYPVEETYYNVVGLITLGTPHAGSRLARFYNYLAQHCMTGTAPPPNNLPTDCPVGGLRNTDSDGCRNDWYLVESLRPTPGPPLAITGIDLRTPGVCYLADNSTQIASLNTKVTGLPPIDYRIVPWSGTALGVVDKFVLGLIPLPILSAASDAAREAILDTGNTPETFSGDGIVSEESQLFENQAIPLWPAHINATLYPPQAQGVVHTEEPSQVDSISRVIADTFTAVGWTTPQN
jgi:pimeloyl-ACP methyl ester carboxylesterase